MKKARMKTTLASAVLFGVSSLAFVGASSAGGSPPQPATIDMVVPAGSDGGCEFDVAWSGSGKAGVIVLPGNRFIYTSPGFNVDVTNLETGKTVSLVVTGAFHHSIRQSDGANVFVATGRNLLGDPDAGMALTMGTFSWIWDANYRNLLQPLDGTGRMVDVCELLG
jgi:hypothetical protein